jgi:hypothetical protein
MTARSAPYPPSGHPIRIGQAMWASALETVSAYASLGGDDGQPGSEALVYLGGVTTGTELIVTGLYRLHHKPQGDRVVVTPDEARWLLQALRARDEKLIAQLHSHRWLAEHSHGDDIWATSFHDGFLSVVVPNFGTGVSSPVDCAVLEYRAGEFVEIPPAEVVRRIVLYPETIARVAFPTRSAPTKERPWRVFARKLKSIARKRL